MILKILQNPKIRFFATSTLIILVAAAWAWFDFSFSVSAQSTLLQEGETETADMVSYSPPQPEDFLNTLVLGIDQHGLSDVIIVVSLNMNDNMIVITSISRDTYVEEQNWADKGQGVDHLCFASYAGMGYESRDYHAGAENAASWVEHLFGIRVDEYVLLTFDDFVELIDLIGGVEIEVSPDFAGISHKISSKTIDPLPVGLQRLNGKQAFAYAHYRGGSDEARIPETGSNHDDGDRIKRNQRLLKAIYEQMRTKNLPEIMGLARIVPELVHTSINVWDLTALAPKLYRTQFDQMVTITIPGELVESDEELNGKKVFYYYVDYDFSNALLEGLGIK